MPQFRPRTSRGCGRLTAVTLFYVWHSDQETADTISASGLAAVTRTYAKVIAETDAIDLKEMRAAIAAR
jgi:hypothetical protein